MVKKAIRGIVKSVKKAPKQAAEKTLKGLLKPVKVILMLSTRIIIILRTFIRQIFLYAKCFIKLLTNYTASHFRVELYSGSTYRSAPSPCTDIACPIPKNRNII